MNRLEYLIKHGDPDKAYNEIHGEIVRLADANTRVNKVLAEAVQFMELIVPELVEWASGQRESIPYSDIAQFTNEINDANL